MSVGLPAALNQRVVNESKASKQTIFAQAAGDEKYRRWNRKDLAI
jgi:hypothetical protein